MSIWQTNTAVLFFSRSERLENQFKSLLDPSINGRLIKSLQSRTRSQIRKTNLPYYVFDEQKQKGSDFGERIANAFDELFALGYEKIIAVGNDCPELKASDISDSTYRLSTLDVVVGPDHRGGAYLIGISRKAFDHKQFKKLAWQTDGLVESLVNAIPSSKVSFLTARFDLNTESDVLKYRSKSSILDCILRSVVFKGCISTELPLIGKEVLFASSNKRRGPPMVA